VPDDRVALPREDVESRVSKSPIPPSFVSSDRLSSARMEEPLRYLRLARRYVRHVTWNNR